MCDIWDLTLGHIFNMNIVLNLNKILGVGVNTLDYAFLYIFVDFSFY